MFNVYLTPFGLVGLMLASGPCNQMVEPALEDLLPLAALREIHHDTRQNRGATPQYGRCVESKSSPDIIPNCFVPHELFRISLSSERGVEQLQGPQQNPGESDGLGADGAWRGGIHHCRRLHVHIAQLGSKTTACNYLQARSQTPAVIYVRLYKDVQYLIDQVEATGEAQGEAASQCDGKKTCKSETIFKKCWNKT